MGSGRTDAGVHALMQVAHFDTEVDLPDDFRYKLNSILPDDIAVHGVRQVKEESSARFDAISRSYLYKIHRSKQPFLTGYSYFFTKELDLEVMETACGILKDHKDFQCFSKVHTDVNNYLCELHHASWESRNDTVIFSVRANRFLRGMVRAMVGTLLDIGQGRQSVEELEEILKSKDRKRAGRSVPAHGLYLSEIKFPDNIFIH